MKTYKYHRLIAQDYRWETDIKDWGDNGYKVIDMKNNEGCIECYLMKECDNAEELISHTDKSEIDYGEE